LAAAVILLLAALPFAQPASQVDPREIAAVVASTVNAWSSRNGIYLAPGFLDDVTAGTQVAVHAACWGTPAQCEQARSPAAVSAVVNGYLDALAGNPVAVLLPGDRLFARIGFDKAALGWPSAPAANRYLVIDLPDRASEISYVGWNGARPIPGSTRRILVPQGVHGLLARTQAGGDTSSLRLIARRNSSGFVAHQWSPQAPQGGPLVSPWRVDPELARFCLDKPVDPTEPKYRLSTGRGAAPIADASDFLSAEILRIELQGDRNDCDDSCKEWVGASVVQALAQWRAGCTRCAPSTLSVVQVGSATYVAVRYVETALQLPYLRPQLSSGGVLASEVAYMATSRGAGVNARMGFQRVNGLATALDLCAGGASSALGFPSLSSRARDEVCQPAKQPACSRSNGCKEILLRLSGASDCANALACGFADQSVTLNTPRFRFSLLGPTSSARPAVQLGRAGAAQGSRVVPLHPVVLHEVGHWFGLPHVDPDPEQGREEVMVDQGGDDRACISQAAMNMLDSAVDRAWQFRHTGSGKLLYAPH
jgi:hypothetical protein